jgi:outer membrane receptor protein involved in Fe transport
MRPTDGRGAPRNARVYRTVILLVSAACGGVAIAQTNNPPVPPASPPGGNSTNIVNSSTNVVGSSTNVVKLAPTTVVGKLDVARNQIVPDLGATVYTINEAQIAALPQGENAPFNTILLATPGMAQDSAVNGDLHLRGEHANIQYRINDVLLPEGITGFGEELDTRFVDSLRLITGSLPAQYGFRTAGVVDLTTKSGAFAPGGEASVYGGSYDTIKPSFELGGSKGNLNYFVDGSYNHNGIGIENPTPSATPVHDDTDQFKAFTYLSYIMDETSRLSVMGSASYADFQVPNTPGLPAGAPSVALGVTATNWNTFMPGTPTFDSSALNENQNEQNYYAVAAYQKSLEDFNLQVALFARESTVHFTPDPVGDLYFNGVASDVDRKLYSGGLQLDASYNLGESHTVRAGVMVLDESLSADTTTTVFPVDANGNPTGSAYPIVDNNVAHALFFGVYLQDEWKVLPKVTLNYGARFDLYYASFDKENQPSPRVNLIYKPTDSLTLHAGYARYFTPPPLENVPSTSVAKFNGTSNASAITQDDPVKAERANYYDAGISQKLAPGLQVGVDGYYKDARNQLDDGLFGQTLILSAFNYAEGEVYGLEATGSYTTGGFSMYANVAYSVAQGEDWDSAQFLFDPADRAYVQNHWIYLDHDQRVTGSFGASYLWKHDSGNSRFSVNALYGSGLRTDATAPDGSNIPNGGSVPPYYSVGMGFEETFKIAGKERLKARLDVVNITDNAYELRSGTGVGVNAAQYGMRLGFFGTISYVF